LAIEQELSLQDVRSQPVDRMSGTVYNRLTLNTRKPRYLV